MCFKSIQSRGEFFSKYLLKDKDKAIKKFFLYKNEVLNQLNNKMMELRNNHGGKYVVLCGSLR